MENVDFSSLVSMEEIEKAKEFGSSGDSNYWKPPNGKSVVRLLPRFESKSPFKTVWTHRSPKNHETHEIGTCLRTWGQKGCPICDKSWKLWNSEIKAEKDLGYAVKKGERHIYNIYVVKDDEHPENVGQVKLLSVGVKLQQMITDAASSEDLGLDIYQPENGFDLEINKNPQGKDGFPDYTSSRFHVKRYTLPIDMGELAKKLFNIDKLIPVHTAEELKKKFSFLFEGDTTFPSVGSNSNNVKSSSIETSTDESFENDDIDEELQKLL